MFNTRHFFGRVQSGLNYKFNFIRQKNEHRCNKTNKEIDLLIKFQFKLNFL